MIAENVADEGLVIRDLKLVHRRTRGDPTFLDAPRRSPPDRTPPVAAVASGSRSISRATRDAPASACNRSINHSIGTAFSLSIPNASATFKRKKLREILQLI